jgi:hypothetical protein
MNCIDLPTTRSVLAHYQSTSIFPPSINAPAAASVSIEGWPLVASFNPHVYRLHLPAEGIGFSLRVLYRPIPASAADDELPWCPRSVWYRPPRFFLVCVSQGHLSRIRGCSSSCYDEGFPGEADDCKVHHTLTPANDRQSSNTSEKRPPSSAGRQDACTMS